MSPHSENMISVVPLGFLPSLQLDPPVRPFIFNHSRHFQPLSHHICHTLHLLWTKWMNVNVVMGFPNASRALSLLTECTFAAEQVTSRLLSFAFFLCLPTLWRPHRYPNPNADVPANMTWKTKHFTTIKVDLSFSSTLPPLPQSTVWTPRCGITGGSNAFCALGAVVLIHPQNAKYKLGLLNSIMHSLATLSSLVVRRVLLFIPRSQPPSLSLAATPPHTFLLHLSVYLSFCLPN